MKYDDVGNIWSVDLGALSNGDRGRCFERAKQVVESAEDPKQRAVAVAAGRFRRKYLASKIGSGLAVTTQIQR